MTKKRQNTRSNFVLEIPEIEVVFHRERKLEFKGPIKHSEDAAEMLRGIYKEGEIELHEVFNVLFFDRNNQPIGYYRHAVGGISGVVSDVRIILAAALQSLATSIILCHNHPSGNLNESDADRKVTKEIVAAARYHHITILDHIILTKDAFSSFADKGLMGVDGPYPIQFDEISLAKEKQSKHKEENLRLELMAKAVQLELELMKI